MSMRLEDSEAVDFHIHTSFSDSEASIHDLINEAAESGVQRISFCDHANITDRNKNYGSNNRFYDPAIFPSGNPGQKNFYHVAKVFDIFESREYALIEEALDNDRCVLTDAYDLESLPDRVTDPDAVDIEEEPVLVHNGIELDYNPPIAEASTLEEENEIVSGYNTRLKILLALAENRTTCHELYIGGEFREVEKQGIGFDVRLGSVHDVFVGGKPCYVKKDDRFKGLSREDRAEVVDLYFRKLEHLVDSEIYDICAHPSLIERNDRLMRSLPTGDFDTRDEQLSSYYSSLIESFEDSKTIPEFNGKGVERQEPGSVFWELVKERDLPHTRGSDSHRLGEISSRMEDFEQVEEGKRPCKPAK